MVCSHHAQSICKGNAANEEAPVRISLEMLAYDLSSFDVECDVTTSARTLRCARIEDAANGLPNGSLCCRQHGNDVVCSCPEGTLVFHDQKLHGVFNKLLDRFRFYDAWELELAQSLFRPDNWQRIVDSLERVFDNPLYIVNRYGRMLGITAQYAEEPITSDWTIIARDRVLNSGAFAIMKNHPVEADPALVSPGEEDTCTYLQCALVPEDAYNYVLYVLEWNHRLTVRDIHVAEALRDAASSIDRSCFHHVPAMKLFEDLIEGELRDTESLNWALLQLGWQQSPGFRMIALQQSDECDGNLDALVAGRLQKHLPQCVCFPHAGTVIVIVDDAMLAESLHAIESATFGLRYRTAVSIRFDLWNDLQRRYREIGYALRYAKSVDALSISCESHVKDLLSYAFDDFCSSDHLLHPVAIALRNHDAAHRTELLRTMCVHLANERSVSATAAELYVHRNTILYRLSSIDKLTGAVDWNDPMERMHFMLSCTSMRLRRAT